MRPSLPVALLLGLVLSCVPSETGHQDDGVHGETEPLAEEVQEPENVPHDELSRIVDNNDADRLASALRSGTRWDTIIGTRFGERTLFSYSVATNKTAIVELLLESGADPNAVVVVMVDAYGESPSRRSALAHAAWSLNPELVSLLMQYGAEPDGPLFVEMASQGYFNVVEAMLRNGADPNTVNRSGQTALHVAIGRTYSKLLLDYGADPNIRDENGNSPLNMIMHKSSTISDYLPVLIQGGADPNNVNDSGWTPLYAAVNPLSVHSVEQLLIHGATVSAQDQAGNVLLSLPLWYLYTYETGDQRFENAAKILHLLLEDGADINVQERMETQHLFLLNGERIESTVGFTLLHYAALWNSSETVAFLLSLGADPTIVDALDRTPYDIADFVNAQQATATLSNAVVTSDPVQDSHRHSLFDAFLASIAGLPVTESRDE